MEVLRTIERSYQMMVDYTMAAAKMGYEYNTVDGGWDSWQVAEEDGKELYLINDRGRLVARELKSDLLSSVLDKSLTQALRYLDFKKRNVVARCTVERTHDNRYQVTATFTEKGVCIFSQSLVVDTENRAERMRNNFYDRPETVYRGVVALMAGNVNYLFD